MIRPLNQCFSLKYFCLHLANWLLYRSIFFLYGCNNASVTVIIELLSALLEYLDLLNEIVQSAIVKALLSQHNSWFSHIPIMLEIMLA